jgi:HSP20 family protein
MSLMKWQPMTDVMELSNLLDRTFHRNSYPRTQSRGPKLALDIYETKEHLVLQASLPGARKEDIKVEFEDQLLTVTATVKEMELPEGATSLLQESVPGTVTRTLKIPHLVDVENSLGRFRDGVLEVTFPKAAETRRKSIVIE